MVAVLNKNALQYYYYYRFLQKLKLHYSILNVLFSLFFANVLLISKEW